MGDMILMTAVARRLSERFDAPCDVIASQGSPQLVFHGLPWIGDVFTIQSRRWNYWISREQQDLVRQLRRRGPSPTFVLDELEKVRWLLERAGLTEPLCLRNGGSHAPNRADLEHQLDFGLRLASAGSFPELGVDADWSRVPAPVHHCPELLVDDLEREDCEAWLEGNGWHDRPLVLIQALSRRRRRGRWATPSWQRLVEAIRNRLPDVRILLIGSGEEAALLKRLCNEIADPSVSTVAGQLPLRRLFALLERAHSCVSIDTGPAHAAAALGCPLVVLMGRADPRRNVPRGPAPIAVCTAYDGSDCGPEVQWPEHWPATRLQWETEHQLQDIPADVVVQRWLDVANDGTRKAAERAIGRTVESRQPSSAS